MLDNFFCVLNKKCFWNLTEETFLQSLRINIHQLLFFRLKEVIPSVCAKDNVTQLDIILEAIRYIDSLKNRLADRIENGEVDLVKVPIDSLKEWIDDEHNFSNFPSCWLDLIRPVMFRRKPEMTSFLHYNHGQSNVQNQFKWMRTVKLSYTTHQCDFKNTICKFEFSSDFHWVLQ